jgi:hypothetical protein
MKWKYEKLINNAICHLKKLDVYDIVMEYLKDDKYLWGLERQYNINITLFSVIRYCSHSRVDNYFLIIGGYNGDKNISRTVIGRINNKYYLRIFMCDHITIKEYLL